MYCAAAPGRGGLPVDEAGLGGADADVVAEGRLPLNAVAERSAGAAPETVRGRLQADGVHAHEWAAHVDPHLANHGPVSDRPSTCEQD